MNIKNKNNTITQFDPGRKRNTPTKNKYTQTLRIIIKLKTLHKKSTFQKVENFISNKIDPKSGENPFG